MQSQFKRHIVNHSSLRHCSSSSCPKVQEKPASQQRCLVSNKESTILAIKKAASVRKLRYPPLHIYGPNLPSLSFVRQVIALRWCEERSWENGELSWSTVEIVDVWNLQPNQYPHHLTDFLDGVRHEKNLSRPTDGLIPFLWRDQAALSSMHACPNVV